MFARIVFASAEVVIYDELLPVLVVTSAASSRVLRSVPEQSSLDQIVTHSHTYVISECRQTETSRLETGEGCTGWKGGRMSRNLGDVRGSITGPGCRLYRMPAPARQSETS